MKLKDFFYSIDGLDEAYEATSSSIDRLAAALKLRLKSKDEEELTIKIKKNRDGSIDYTL